MKRIKVILALICIFIALLSCEAFADSTAESEKEFLDCLGITDGIDMTSDTNITRAEFTAMVIRMTNQASLFAPDGSFSDVGKESPFASEIYSAKALHITNGTSESTFTPDAPILTKGAYKMAVIALGYESYAQAMGSGGYVSMASRLKLPKAVSQASHTYLTREDAVHLIYTCLYTDISEITGVSDGDVIFTTSGKNLLNSNFKLTSVEGVVTTAGFISDSDLYAGSDVIEINGKVLKCFLDCSSSFGKNVIAWYDSDNNTVRAIDILQNNVISIDAADIIGYSDFVLTVETENGGEKKYKLAKNFGFMKNGRLLAHTDDDFVFEGTATLIDNNTDGLYDYFMAESIEYFVVTSFNTADEIAYDRSSSLCYVELESSVDRTCNIYLYDSKTDTYKHADSSVVTVGKTLMVMQSDDRTVCKIFVSETDTIKGVVQEIGDDFYIIDQTRYKINSYFKANSSSVTPGTAYTFFIAPDKTLTLVDSVADSKLHYGFVIDRANTNGIANETKLKILTQDNKREAYSLADKVNINGTVADAGSPACASITKNSLIRYSLNKDGKISYVETAADGEITQEVSYGRNSGFTCYGKGIAVKYKGSGNIAMPNFILKNSIIISVPSSLMSSPDGIYPDESYNIKSLSALSNDEDYTIDVYDLDSNFYPAVVVVYCNSSDLSEAESAGEYSKTVMVTDVTSVYDDEGLESCKIYAFDGQKYVDYVVSSSVYPTLKDAGKIPGGGDIVRLVISNNTVKGIAIDVDYNALDASVKINYGKEILSTATNSVLTYISGNVITADSNSIVLDIDEAPTPNTGSYINNIAAISINSPKYIIYNRSTGEAYAGREGSLYSGEQNPYVVCKLSYYQSQNVYIYID